MRCLDDEAARVLIILQGVCLMVEQTKRTPPYTTLHEESTPPSELPHQYL